MKRFLIGQLARYGDCLFATVIAKQIKQDYPQSHITWAIASNFKSILENNPYIDEIWDIHIDDGDYYGENWYKFEREAEKRKENGDFEEIIYSQVCPRNMHKFSGLIRNSTLQSYRKYFTVSLEPVVVLSSNEVNEVGLFVERNQLDKYQQVILFECAPGSGQSKLTVETATNIAERLIKNRSDIAVIISSNIRLECTSNQIIDGSVLTFRHQAELTKYCSLFIGCSSGLTWLITSTWAKKLPMIQVLDRESLYFAGVSYDFRHNNIDDTFVIEILTFSEDSIVDCAKMVMQGDFQLAKSKFHQEYLISYKNFIYMNQSVLTRNKFIEGFKQVIEYKMNHRQLSFFRLVFCYLKNIYFAFKLRNRSARKTKSDRLF